MEQDGLSDHERRDGLCHGRRENREAVLCDRLKLQCRLCSGANADDQAPVRQNGRDSCMAWVSSFAEGEVDADTAHKIGVALAKELWPDFEVIVATHLNTHCFHNHFVLNSVSFLHGRKFNACRESYKKMRAASDRLCRNMACRS